jgi:hypothetical protein
MPKSARIYVSSIIAMGAVVCGGALLYSRPPLSIAVLVYLALSFAAGLLKVRLPGITGTYSIVFLPVLAGIAHFGLTVTLLGMIVGTLAQTLLRTQKRPTAVQALFNIANLSVSIAIAQALFDWLVSGGAAYRPSAMALAAAVFFATNTCLVSGILSLLQGTRLGLVCQTWYLWSFPYYLIGAALVILLPSARPEAWIILLPLAYLVHFYSGLSGTPRLDEPADAAEIPLPARMYAHTIISAGVMVLAIAGLEWVCNDWPRLVAYLALAFLTATWKVRLPGMTGTVSVSFVLLLVAVLQLGFAETVLIGTLMGVVQCVWKPQRKPMLLQILFSAACLELSSALAYLVCRVAIPPVHALALLVGLATVILYLTNTVLVAGVLTLVSGGTLRGLWQRCYFWSFPYYLVGSAAAGVMLATADGAGWMRSIVIVPIMGMVYVSYRTHLSQSRMKKYVKNLEALGFEVTIKPVSGPTPAWRVSRLGSGAVTEPRQ